MPGATGFSFVGIGKETTKGTAVSATHYIPVTSMDGDDSCDILLDNGMRASMATSYGAVAGTKVGSFSMEGDVFVDTIGFPLAGIFGTGAFTGGTPNTHLFTLNNEKTTTKGQCPSYSITDFNGLQTRRYAAATQASLSLRLTAQELFTWSAGWTTNPSDTLSVPTPSYGTLPPIAGWVGTVSVAGSANALVEEMDISISRNVTPVQTVDGTQAPALIWQGAMDVSGSIRFIADAEVEFLRYLNYSGTPHAMEVTFTQGTAEVKATLSQVVYTSAKVDRGDDFTQVTAQYQALANATDAGVSGGFAPCKVSLKNSIATGIYSA